MHMAATIHSSSKVRHATCGQLHQSLPYHLQMILPGLPPGANDACCLS